MKLLKLELVEDKETTKMNVNRINFYSNFKWSFSDFIANDLQIFTLDPKWAGGSTTTCLLYSEVSVNLNKVFHILFISALGILHFASAV